MRLEGVKVTSGGGSLLSLAEAKAYLRIDGTDDDDLLLSYIEAATDAVEAYTGRALILQSIQSAWSDVRCGDVLPIPRPPLIAISSVAYIDEDGVSQTLAEGDEGYELETVGEPAQLRILSSLSSIDASRLGHFVVTYDAGYGGRTDVPARLHAATKNALSTLFDGSCNEPAGGDGGGGLLGNAQCIAASLRVPGVHFAGRVSA